MRATTIAVGACTIFYARNSPQADKTIRSYQTQAAKSDRTKKKKTFRTECKEKSFALPPANTKYLSTAEESQVRRI